MNRPLKVLVCLVAALFLGIAARAAVAQGAAARANPERHRPLAPGVLKSVDPEREVEESFSRHDLVELLAFDPNFDWAKDVAFRHDVWALDFKFKPMRMIWVDMPQPGGRMQRKLIWYMVYSATNTGKTLHPVLDDDKTYKPTYVDRPVLFIPEFVLESHEFGKAYPDRVIPVAMGQIQAREGRGNKIHTAVEMTSEKGKPRQIAIGQALWGVACWEDIDPRIDRFSVYVYGLTNAYRWKDEPGRYKKGDRLGTGRRLMQKTLKLNYWRPGDEYYETEREIRYGTPGELDYQWVYR